MNNEVKYKIKSIFLRPCVFFLSLVVFLIGINWPYLARTFTPIVDTLSTFNLYHFFYSELFCHNQLVQWLPYGTYGQSANFAQITTFTPMSCLAASIGLIFRISDVLFLYKISIFFELLVFLAGMWWLCCSIFKRLSTAIFVCIAAIAGIVWYSQISFNLRFFYLFPIVITCCIKMFQKKDSFWFWCIGLTCLAWMFGNVIYFVELYIFVLVFTMLGLWLVYPANMSTLAQHSRRAVTILTIFCLILIIYAIYLKFAVVQVSLFSPGREADGKTIIDTFLVYGGIPDIGMLIKSFALGLPTFLPIGCGWDNSIYFGLAGFVFFIWALIYCREKLMLTFILPLVVLVLFSFGGIFTRCVYYIFPGMSYYRHIGLIWPLIKIIMIIIAGFGWEQFWPIDKKKVWQIVGIVAGLFIVIEIVDSPLNVMLKRSMAGDFFDVLIRIAVYGVCVLGLFAIAKKNKYNISCWIMTGILLALIFDMIIFQYRAYALIGNLDKKYWSLVSATDVAQLNYQSQRSNIIANRQVAAYALVHQPRSVVDYALPLYNFMQFDPDQPRVRVDMVTSAVKDFFSADIKSTETLNLLTGTSVPKLRLVSQAISFPTIEQMVSAIKNNQIDENTVALLNSAETSGYSAPNNQKRPGVEVTKFTNSELIAQICAENDSWLIYADSWHPGWQAFVDGQRQQIRKANIAFKAVAISRGCHEVRFVFRNGPNYWLSWVIAGIGIIFGLLGIIFIGRMFFRIP